jgi:ribosome-binding protein aMBF1 (putative translation factor)
VIVEQHARWRDVATGERQDRRVIGSEFVVRNGRVVRYVRHDSGVADALLAARLDEEQDLVRSVVSGG